MIKIPFSRTGLLSAISLSPFDYLICSSSMLDVEILISGLISDWWVMIRTFMFKHSDIQSLGKQPISMQVMDWRLPVGKIE